MEHQKLGTVCLSLSCEDTASRWPCVSQEKRSDQEPNWPEPSFWLPSLQNGEDKFLLFKLPNLWYFVIIAWTAKTMFYFLFIREPFLFLKISVTHKDLADSAFVSWNETFLKDSLSSLFGSLQNSETLIESSSFFTAISLFA